MTRLGLALLRTYVGLFAFFAPNREHARNEHALLEGGVRDAYGRYRAKGLARTPAAFAALWEHATELQPLALLLKTRADAAAGPGADGGYRRRLAAGVGSVFFVGATALVLVGLGGSNIDVPTHTVAMALPEGDASTGGVAPVLGTFATLRESIYAATGGTVCLPEGIEGPDLTDELVNTPSTPEQLKQCEGFELPPRSDSGLAPVQGTVGGVAASE